jgi:hypothetical protein
MQDNNTLPVLREHLFDTLKELKAGSVPLDRARLIVDVSQAIINSAKVEVGFIKAVNATGGSGFIPLADKNG